METSILTSTKKVLGLADDYVEFDEDILMHINSTFSTLNQVGIGPDVGFTIVDKTTEWDAFVTDEVIQNAVKTYVFLKVRMLFDPPVTSYLLDAMNKQIGEQEWRINVLRETTEWVDPDPPAPPDEEEVLL